MESRGIAKDGEDRNRTAHPNPAGVRSRAGLLDSRSLNFNRRVRKVSARVEGSGASLDDWIVAMRPADRRELFGRFHESARVILAAQRAPGTRMTEDEALGTAILMEYGAAIGVCPLELHWLLGDVMKGLSRAVLAVHVQEMLGEVGLARQSKARSRNRSPVFGLPAANGPRRHVRTARRVKASRSSAWINTVVR